MEATLIAAPSSIKNANGERNSEMKQSTEGNQWHFGMNTHIGAGGDSGLMRVTSGTSSSVNGVLEVNSTLHGDETEAFGDAGSQGADKRADAKPNMSGNIAARPGKPKTLEKAGS